MRYNLRRRMVQFTVCVLTLGLLAGLMPFGNERAYAGTGGEIDTVAGGEYGDLVDVPAVGATLSSPSAVTIDVYGNLYIADTGNNRVKKVDAVTKNISIVAGAGAGPLGYNFSGDGGPALNAAMRSPAGVAVDADGNLYIADKYNNRIRKVDFSSGIGIITTVAGTGENDFSGDNGPADEAELSSPSGVAIDGDGNLYIADTSNHRIRKVDAVTKIITTVAGASSYGTFYGDGGPAVAAELNEPSAIATDSLGNLYIADTYNNRIRKVDAVTKIISTVAGSTSVDGFDGDGGPAQEARLNEPEGVALDSDGNLYISDTDNNRIRKVLRNGIIMTIAGTGAAGYSGDVGPGIQAELDTPSGITLDSGGNLYIADYFNHAIRKQDQYIPSNDASLDGITLSHGTLSPAFRSDETDYTASVVNGVTSIRVTPTMEADSFVTVTVNGVRVASGAESGDISLATGNNKITLLATAEDGETKKEYTIIVNRSLSDDARLSQMTLSHGTLDPEFDSSREVYAAIAGQSEITVTPTLADDRATVTVDGMTVTSKTASQPIPLNLGSVNEIKVVVTAQNGTTKTYTINVTRTISANADLSGMSLSIGTLTPSGANSYTASVGNSVSSITVTPTTADGSATVTVNDVAVASGTASASLPLVVGGNTITVKVTAENGTTKKSYTITLTRAESSNADLSDLTLPGAALTPSFLPGTYKASVDYSVNSVTVTPTVSDAVYAAAQVSLYNGSGVLVVGPIAVPSGTTSPTLPLAVGSNTVTVLVTAQDGTTKMYTVTVTRGASSNADLSNLTLSNGALTPAFAGTYTASVDHSVSSITVTPTLSDVANASATASLYDGGGALVSGPHAVASGSASPALPLSVGDNVIKVIVTAQDGATRTYMVTVTRAASGTSAPVGGGGGGGGGGVFINKPVIDFMGQSLDPAGIDTKKPFVTLELMPKDGVAYVGMPASVLTDLAAKNADFYLEIRTSYGIYQVPANLASIIPGSDALFANNRLKAEDVSFKIALTDKSGDKQLLTRIHSLLPDGELLGAVADFHIEIVHTNTGLTVGAADMFDQEITRLIPLPKYRTEMPEHWGAFRYNETTKACEFVPAKAVQIDGAWYVRIDSYSNSTYIAVENTTSFADMEKHWSQSFVEQAAAKGLVAGVGGRRYDPDKVVTRAEFTAMLVRALSRGNFAADTMGYADVKMDAWYSDSVARAKKLGLLDYARGTEFRPDQPLTREEMASMLAAAVALEKLTVTTEAVSLDNYIDIGSVESAYTEDIRLMVKLQIMTGTSEQTFSPQGLTTRAQAATVLLRALQALGKID